jgi:hypothetical protein
VSARAPSLALTGRLVVEAFGVLVAAAVGAFPGAEHAVVVPGDLDVSVEAARGAFVVLAVADDVLQRRRVL